MKPQPPSVRKYVIAFSALTLCALAMTPLAMAAEAPKTLWTQASTCPTPVPACSGAGETSVPRGIAADPNTGHVFVADQVNQRVQELDAWGQFVKAWGWGVRDGSNEFQTCTSATGCQSGIQGTGVGQFQNPQGITLDSAGDVYVFDKENLRIQKFDADGNFLLMIGGGVDQGPNHPGNLCTAAYIAEGDSCGAGSQGTANGQFGNIPYSGFIDVGPSNELYVGDENRIQVFNPDGTYLKSISIPGHTPSALALDATGNIYVSYYSEEFIPVEANVHKLSPAGEELCTAAVAKPSALAVDGSGRLYVGNTDPDDPAAFFTSIEMQRFSPSCEKDQSYSFLVGIAPNAEEQFYTTGIAVNTVTSDGGVGLYFSNANYARSFVRAYYPPPDRWAPPTLPPSIEAQYALSASSTEAELRADINPRFWADTRVYVEYGPSECSVGGCAKTSVSQLNSGIVGEAVASPTVVIGGLLPNTTYHYRFVAESSGGGPVRGLGGKVGEDGAEAIFRTFGSKPSPRTDCPNEAFRIGGAVRLADCRAYEMVSPVEKYGGDANTGSAFGGLAVAASNGERYTFTTLTSFGEAQSAPLFSQFMSSRGAQGWSTEPISPPRKNPGYYPPLAAGQFKSFSEDLCQAWIIQDSPQALEPEVQDVAPNPYRRDNCGEGGYRALSAVAPPGFEHEFPETGYLPNPQGHSNDGSRAVFRANAELTGNACEEKVFQVYASSEEGPLRLVNILPSGKVSCAGASAGSFNGSGDNFYASSVYHAMSADGSRVFWTAGQEFEGKGTLYVRLNATQRPAKRGTGCSEPEKACTLAVSEGPGAFFWGADPGGNTAIYTRGGSLFEFDVETATNHLIAGGALGVAGMSEDASRVYFASTQVLSGEQENSFGAKAQAGEGNLYLYEKGEGFTYIGTLSPDDLHTSPNEAVNGRVRYSPVATNPVARSVRVSPDGLHFAFGSVASLTGYDNRDLASRRADNEVFLFDAESGGAGDLHCISCNPSEARPRGRLTRDGETQNQAWSAAILPGWPGQLNPTRLLSSDGNRLFFESFESLVPNDTNGKQDVYEWERADDEAGCQAFGMEAYVASAGGCLGLISSGQSPVDSELIDASVGGADVFFTTNSSLLPQDPGLIDVYDARQNGGFPQPPAPRPSCEGEACQGPLEAPNDPTPASSSFEGAGNVKEVKERKARKKRAKKKHVKKAPKRTHAKRAGNKGRATR